jgi:hypothetical protein
VDLEGAISTAENVAHNKQTRRRPRLFYRRAAARESFKPIERLVKKMVKRNAIERERERSINGHSPPRGIQLRSYILRGRMSGIILIVSFYLDIISDRSQYNKSTKVSFGPFKVTLTNNIKPIFVYR